MINNINITILIFLFFAVATMAGSTEKNINYKRGDDNISLSVKNNYGETLSEESCAQDPWDIRRNVLIFLGILLVVLLFNELLKKTRMYRR